MPALRHRTRHREPVLEKGRQEGKLFDCRKPAHVHPRRRAAVAQVVAIVLDAPEGDAAQSVDFQRVLSPAGRSSDVDVGFFARADLLACGVEDLPLLMSVQS